MDVLDPLNWVIVSTAVVAIITSALHLYGWLPKRYTARLREVQVGLASQVGLEVENAIERVSVRQKALLEADAAKAATSVDMSLTRASRSLKDAQVDLNAEMTAAILGPALPILRQFAPGLAERLEENPDLLPVIIENPLFQKYVMPRIQAFLGKGGSDSQVTPSWGT
jgi:hypothetical protein